MPKASLTLPNGTVVQVEGTAEEVRDLLQFYGGGHGPASPAERTPPARPKRRRAQSGRSASRGAEVKTGNDPTDLSRIVNLAKDCDEADAIERHILDRTSQVDRTLLPLYIVHEYLENAFGLSSGDITKITTDLGVPISTPNASKTLSGTAAKYVMGDRVRKKGQLVRYRLSRRGVQYMKSVVGGNSDGKPS